MSLSQVCPRPQQPSGSRRDPLANNVPKCRVRLAGWHRRRGFNKRDSGTIRLGDVIVSRPVGLHSGAVQYDHGKVWAGHFERTGRLARPPAVLLNAAQARQRILGDEHSSTISAMNNLAITLSDQGKLDEGAKMVQNVLRDDGTRSRH